MISFEPIGLLKTSFEQKFGTPRQGHLVPSSRGHLKLEKQFWDQGFFEGLEGFSHIWLITAFHLNIGHKVNGKVTPPRLERAMGTFATRSPHRPNPIGLTLVKLIEVKTNEIIVGGVDLMNDTPVLDIKPYIPEDKVDNAKYGWINSEANQTQNQVIWSEQTKALYARLSERQVNMINEALSLNPLPLVYREMEKRNYWLRVESFDICFSPIADGFEVLEIKPLTSQPFAFE